MNGQWSGGTEAGDRNSSTAQHHTRRNTPQPDWLPWESSNTAARPNASSSFGTDPGYSTLSPQSSFRPFNFHSEPMSENRMLVFDSQYSQEGSGISSFSLGSSQHIGANHTQMSIPSASPPPQIFPLVPADVHLPVYSSSGTHAPQRYMYTTLASSQDPVFRHQQDLFLSVPRDFDNVPGWGPFWPQKVYRPHTAADRRRYVEEVLLDEPMYFWNDGLCGIHLVDALNGRVQGLDSFSHPVMTNNGPSASVRLRFTGYDRWTKQIAVQDYRKPRQPITRGKLVREIAKVVNIFLEEKRDTWPEDNTPWHAGHFRLDDLVLVSLHNISKGSWQPQLRLRRPLSHI